MFGPVVTAEAHLAFAGARTIPTENVGHDGGFVLSWTPWPCSPCAKSCAFYYSCRQIHSGTLRASDYVNHTMAQDEPRLKCLHARVTPSSCHP